MKTSENPRIVCANCGDYDPLVQTVTEGKRWNPLLALLYIILIFIPIVGWIVLFIVMVGRKGTVTVTYATCQGCGNRWEI